MSAHVMIDLETYGVVPGCPVLAIGAIVFMNDDRGLLPSYTYYGVARANQDEWNLFPEKNTIDWWSQQTEDARKVFTDPAAMELPALLAEFSEWLPKDAIIWGNGAGFDCPILARAYHAVGLPLPWKFYNERCYRTIKSLAPSVSISRSGTHHNALDDAVSQAEHLRMLSIALGLKLG